MHPGTNVGIGSDDTLYAKVTGIMKVERLGKDKKKISVYPQAEVKATVKKEDKKETTSKTTKKVAKKA